MCLVVSIRRLIYSIKCFVCREVWVTMDNGVARALSFCFFFFIGFVSMCLMYLYVFIYIYRI